ncbi:MAG: SAM-dependent methyltransferase [Polyangia bacterium]
MQRRPPESIASLGELTLEDLQQRFPKEWSIVGEALVAAAQTKRPEALAAFMQRFHEAAQPWQARAAARRPRPADLKSALPPIAKAHMARLAAEQLLRAAAARVATGRRDDQPLRFGRLSGWMIQRLLFERDLVRKAPSMGTFRWLWPLIPQRRMLMPLVNPRGIYCFYSRELVLALADLIGDRTCLEIAAGDGTLSRFLNTAGTVVQATDNRSWSHAIAYPDDVESANATSSLARHQPAVVLCSFPPPKNDFERDVFRSPSVELYVVITTRHRFAAGDWDAYTRQTQFDLTEDHALARLVLPPEIDPTVLIFRRR